MNNIGWEIQSLTDLGWKNAITTVDNKPVVFDSENDANVTLANFRPYIQQGQYRVQEVSK